MLQGDQISYVVDVNALSHKTGTRDVIQSDVTNRTTDMQSENIQNLGNVVVRVVHINVVKFSFNTIAAEVPYSVTVKALNLAGCGEEQQIYCFTQEGRKQDIVANIPAVWLGGGGDLVHMPIDHN